MRVTTAPEQNFTDMTGARMCLRRVAVPGEPSVRYSLHTRRGFFHIGRVEGGQSAYRDVEASWWFVEPADEHLRDGYEQLHENGFPSIGAIIKRHALTR